MPGSDYIRYKEDFELKVVVFECFFHQLADTTASIEGYQLHGNYAIRKQLFGAFEIKRLPNSGP
jgi:hypothetical protein